MLKKILYKVRGSQVGYNLGRKILSSKIVNRSAIYNKIYDRVIEKKIKKLENCYPKAIDIGVTNYCNSSCIMCPHSRLKKHGTMDMELFIKIVDNCKKIGIKDIGLSFFGEAFIDKDIFKRIEYVKSVGLRAAFYSNGSLMNEERARKIIESGLDSITISFDGATKETYEKIRIGLKYDVLKNNLLKLIELKKKLKKSNPSINLVLVELEQNKNEIKDFYEQWKDKVNAINIINMRNWAGDLKHKGTKESFHYKGYPNRKPCSYLWEKMIVDWNGNVVPCCDDWNQTTVLGNLGQNTIEEVWRGEKISKMRELHVKREFHKIPLCSKCNKKTVWWLVN